MHSCTESLRPWSGGSLPSSRQAWDQLYRSSQETIHANEAEHFFYQCSHHSRLANYRPVRYHCEGTWGINRFIHAPSVDCDTARKVTRLLAGGQGLRAGDPRCEPSVTPTNCCVFCLEAGFGAAETLRHATFDCPAYVDARSNPILSDVLRHKTADVFLLHRNRWTWKELRAIIAFFKEVIDTRLALTGACGRRAAAKLQARSDACWDSVATASPS